MNAVRCLNCGASIESCHRHDFKWCDCTNKDCAVAVDGGRDYHRRCFGRNSNWLDLSTNKEYLGGAECKDLRTTQEKVKSGMNANEMSITQLQGVIEKKRARIAELKEKQRKAAAEFDAKIAEIEGAPMAETAVVAVATDVATGKYEVVEDLDTAIRTPPEAGLDKEPEERPRNIHELIAQTRERAAASREIKLSKNGHVTPQTRIEAMRSNGVTLPTRLAEIMRGHKPFSPSDAAKAMLESGWQTNSRQFNNVCNVALTTSPLFVRVSKGMYKVAKR